MFFGSRKRHRFDPNDSNQEGQSRLHFYAYVGAVSGISVYAIAGADVNKQDRFGATPLHYAALNGQQEAVQTLIKLAADPRIKTYDGQSTADAARCGGHEQLERLLQSAIAQYHQP